MKTLSALKYLIILFCTHLLIACGGGGDDPEPPPPVLKDFQFDKGQTLSSNIDRYLDRNLSAKAPGISMMVLRDGQTVYTESRGLRNLQTNSAITVDTPIKLNSVSKQVTAAATLHLVESGRLELDDSILNHLPMLDASWADISIHHLLTHQSGIPNHQNSDDGVYTYEELQGKTDQDLLEYFVNNPDLLTTPGQQYRYTNAGFVMLALIIESISGQTFREYVQEHIFRPFNMNNCTVVDSEGAHLSNRATGYEDNDTPTQFRLYTTGDGNVYCSVNDMNDYLHALFSGQIISVDSLSLMLQSQISRPGDDYSYGWFVKGELIYHMGESPGYASALFHDPVSNTSILLLANKRNLGFMISQLALRILEFYDITQMSDWR